MAEVNNLNPSQNQVHVYRQPVSTWDEKRADELRDSVVFGIPHGRNVQSFKKLRVQEIQKQFANSRGDIKSNLMVDSLFQGPLLTGGQAPPNGMHENVVDLVRTCPIAVNLRRLFADPNIVHMLAPAMLDACRMRSTGKIPWQALLLESVTVEPLLHTWGTWNPSGTSQTNLYRLRGSGGASHRCTLALGALLSLCVQDVPFFQPIALITHGYQTEMANITQWIEQLRNLPVIPTRTQGWRPWGGDVVNELRQMADNIPRATKPSSRNEVSSAGTYGYWKSTTIPGSPVVKGRTTNRTEKRNNQGTCKDRVFGMVQVPLGEPFNVLMRRQHENLNQSDPHFSNNEYVGCMGKCGLVATSDDTCMGLGMPLTLMEPTTVLIDSCSPEALEAKGGRRVNLGTSLGVVHLPVNPLFVAPFRGARSTAGIKNADSTTQNKTVAYVVAAPALMSQDEDPALGHLQPWPLVLPAFSHAKWNRRKKCLVVPVEHVRQAIRVCPNSVFGTKDMDAMEWQEEDPTCDGHVPRAPQGAGSIQKKRWVEVCYEQLGDDVEADAVLSALLKNGAHDNSEQSDEEFDMVGGTLTVQPAQCIAFDSRSPSCLACAEVCHIEKMPGTDLENPDIILRETRHAVPVPVSATRNDAKAEQAPKFPTDLLSAAIVALQQTTIRSLETVTFNEMLTPQQRDDLDATICATRRIPQPPQTFPTLLQFATEKQKGNSPHNRGTWQRACEGLEVLREAKEGEAALIESLQAALEWTWKLSTINPITNSTRRNNSTNDTSQPTEFCDVRLPKLVPNAFGNTFVQTQHAVIVVDDSMTEMVMGSRLSAGLHSFLFPHTAAMFAEHEDDVSWHLDDVAAAMSKVCVHLWHHLHHAAWRSCITQSPGSVYHESVNKLKFQFKDMCGNLKRSIDAEHREDAAYQELGAALVPKCDQKTMGSDAGLSPPEKSVQQLSHAVSRMGQIVRGGGSTDALNQQNHDMQTDATFQLPPLSDSCGLAAISASHVCEYFPELSTKSNILQVGAKKHERLGVSKHSRLLCQTGLLSRSHLQLLLDTRHEELRRLCFCIYVNGCRDTTIGVAPPTALLDDSIDAATVPPEIVALEVARLMASQLPFETLQDAFTGERLSGRGSQGVLGIVRLDKVAKSIHNSVGPRTALEKDAGISDKKGVKSGGMRASNLVSFAMMATGNRGMLNSITETGGMVTHTVHTECGTPAVKVHGPADPVSGEQTFTFLCPKCDIKKQQINEMHNLLASGTFRSQGGDVDEDLEELCQELRPLSTTEEERGDEREIIDPQLKYKTISVKQSLDDALRLSSYLNVCPHYSVT
jgi:hypothetical protein